MNILKITPPPPQSGKPGTTAEAVIPAGQRPALGNTGNFVNPPRTSTPDSWGETALEKRRRYLDWAADKAYRQTAYRVLNEARRLHLFPEDSQCYACGLAPVVNPLSKARQGVYVCKYTDQDKSSGQLRNLATCKSLFLCRVCRIKKTAALAAQVERAHEEWIGKKCEVYMATLTVPHQRGQALPDLLGSSKGRAGLLGAFTRMVNRPAFRAFKTRHNIRLMLRAQETTYGRDHGWHPHLHIAVFSGLKRFGGARSARRARQLQRELFLLWHSACQASGLGAPSREHGVDVTATRSAQAYIAKWSIGSELSKGAEKSGGGGNCSIGELELDLLGPDESLRKRRAAGLLKSYYATMRGKQAIRASGDQETLAWWKSLELPEETQDAPVVKKELLAIIPGWAWAEVRHIPDAHHLIKTAVEGQRLRGLFELWHSVFGRNPAELWRPEAVDALAVGCEEPTTQAEKAWDITEDDWAREGPHHMARAAELRSAAGFEGAAA
jgi:hypothetical protein